MLVATPTDVDHLRTVLMRAALPVVDIAGVVLAGDRIVLGTYAEAKGLSFDHVLMPGLRSDPEAPSPASTTRPSSSAASACGGCSTSASRGLGTGCGWATCATPTTPTDRDDTDLTD